MSAKQPQHPSQPVRSQKRLPGYQQTPRLGAEPDALAQYSADELETVMLRLMELDYGNEGLTRDQIREQYEQLPEAIYLRMPSSRRFLTATEALHDVGFSRGRAEGEFLGARPDIPDADSMADGGPPTWGGDPLLTIDAVAHGGSAEDTQGLALGEGEEAGQTEDRATDLDR